MKNKLISMTLFCSALCFMASGCSSYSDGEEIRAYIQQNGILKNNGQYWYNLDLGQDQNNKNYALYNPDNGKIGVAYVYENSTWSEAANKKIVNIHYEEYGFFEPGKPWEATYYYYNYSIDSTTLEKETAKATFNISKEAFDTKAHLLRVESEYLINFNRIEGDFSKKNRFQFSAISNLSDTFGVCRDHHIVFDMPYIF